MSQEPANGAEGGQGGGQGGRAWVFGDNIDTDNLAPGRYMKGPVEAAAPHCLETLDPDFAGHVAPGDFVIGGGNFGLGSSREQAAQVLRILGVTAVIAKSFGGIFYRNAFNLGLLAVLCPETELINAQDRLALDAEAGVLSNLSSGECYACEPVPGHLLALIADGGLIPHLERRFKSQAGKEGS